MIIPTLFVVAGGSGGHILPALHIAQAWRNHNQTSNIIFFSGSSDVEKKALHNAPVDRIVTMALGKYSLRQWWTLPWRALQATGILIQGLYYCLRYQPERMITTGGLLAIPLGLAAWITRTPLDVYELNVIPGKAIKALMPFASKIYCVFPQSKQYCRWGKRDFSSKCVITHYPLRFTAQDKVVDHAALFERINAALKTHDAQLHFSSSRTTLFIVGGSQGSAFLNNQVKEMIVRHKSLAQRLQVIHQTGSFNETDWQTWYAQQHIPAFTFSYDKRIHEYYKAADLIISRAGAGTLFEIAFFHKPCIVIPLIADTTTHQQENAYAMAERYPALFDVLQQVDVATNPDLLYDHVMQKIAKAVLV